jgi:hypothetical protein
MTKLFLFVIPPISLTTKVFTFSVVRKLLAMKHAALLFSLILSACLSSALSFNQTRITEECLSGLMLSETENLKCVTQKGVSVQMVKSNSQTFYCIKYEKKSGNVNMYDLLSFDLAVDYDLKFVSNVAFAVNHWRKVINFRLEPTSSPMTRQVPSSSSTIRDPKATTKEGSLSTALQRISTSTSFSSMKKNKFVNRQRRSKFGRSWLSMLNR